MRRSFPLPKGGPLYGRRLRTSLPTTQEFGSYYNMHAYPHDTLCSDLSMLYILEACVSSENAKPMTPDCKCSRSDSFSSLVKVAAIKYLGFVI